jgi:TonB-linked SusC/RagA family outer membrane protein
MRKIILITMLLFTVSFAMAQRTVSGRVTGSNGEPLAAATIQEYKNEKNAAVADKDGKFSITVKGNKTQLVISSVGYKAKTITVPAQGDVEIELESDNADMDEVVVVGFAKQKKITNVGSVSTVSGKELRQSPAASIQNSLAGRLPGLFQQQGSGQPGRDAANIFIRGVSSYTGSNTPLIIIDDVEASTSQLTQMDPNEVENISILKDASSTAIYGVKGANGVIIVTTRRGKTGSARITFRTEAGLQMPTVKRKPLGAYDALTLLKEQLINSGSPNPEIDFPNLYSTEALEHFRTGDMPLQYPNVNWYDEVMRKSTLQQRNNLDISGGTNNVRYFISLGYIFQNGILKEVPKDEDFNSNYYLKRYNIRSNLDVDVYKGLALKIDLSARFSDVNQPNLPDVTPGGAWPFWRRITSGLLTPWKYPVKNADGSYAGKNGETLNPVGILQYAGYSRTYNTDLNANLSAIHKLDFLTKGLSLRGTLAYTNNFNFTRSLTRGRFPVYDRNVITGIYSPVFPELSRIEPLVRGGSVGTPFRRLNTQLILDYNRTIKGHNVYGLALFNRSTDISGSAAPANFQGFAGRLGYIFKQKYMVELNAGYNGSDRFKAKKRYGFFPAISAGWNISEEKFFSDNIHFIDFFKLKGSYGLVGSDDVGGNRYIYEEVYTRSTGAYYFGENPTADERILPGTLANADVRWEIERKANVAAEIKMFNRKLEINAEYFDNYRYDILTTRESVPLYTGLNLPVVNIGEVSNKGWEFELIHRNTVGKEFQYFVKGNFSYAKNKILFRDEPANAANPMLRKTGRPIGQLYGYIAEGFYYDDADVAKSPVTVGRTVKPGDIKFKDVNGDNKIDQGDIGPIGHPNLPQITYGFSTGFSYKGFDVSALFQGAARGSLMASTLLQIGNANGLPSAIHMKRWTPETRDVAEYPRLGGVNFDASTFWLRPTDYLRLKNVEVGYRLPNRLIKSLKLNDFRVYANALNLVTWFKLKIYDVDPESFNGDGATSAYSDYPQQKVVNFGVQITF